MAGYVIGLVIIVVFGLLAAWGESLQRWAEARRLRRHTCHTTCSESRWCKCGCRDGVFGVLMGTCCVVCGTQYVSDNEEEWGPYSRGPARQTSETTHEMPAPKGQTTWGHGHERAERMELRGRAGDE